MSKTQDHNGPLFVQLYEEGDDGSLRYNGINFELRTDFYGEVPRPGDTIVSPLRKVDFEPRNPDTHWCFVVQRRYFLPDVTASQANIVKLVVKRSRLTTAERGLFDMS